MDSSEMKHLPSFHNIIANAAELSVIPEGRKIFQAVLTGEELTQDLHTGAYFTRLA